MTKLTWSKISQRLLPRRTTKQIQGAATEYLARQYLEAVGMQCIAQNYRCKGGEIDLIMQVNDGTLVFVEVRSRNQAEFGGAMASITAEKQRKIILAAQHYLMQYQSLPACRFDVIAFEGGQTIAHLHWVKDAFSA